MGLFDTIVGEAAGALSSQSGTHGGLMDVVSGLVRGGGSGGGLDALIAQFQQKGLGELADSWVGTGRNLSISADQLQSVLGSAQVQAIAGKLGMSSNDLAGALANLLPQVVDRLTPNGQVPSQDLVEQGLSMLKGLQGRG